MRVEMFEFITFALLVITLCTVGVIVARFKNKNLELLLGLQQAISVIELIREDYDKDSSIEKEHLIEFLNQSRDVAYKYIEDLHNALLEYENEIKFDLENPSDLSIHRFRSAFEKLKNFYPEDIPND
jgi:c-di-AMP phosphodiesterase-like protein